MCIRDSYNGVAPTEESLKDGSYPLTDGYYAVLRKDTPEDAPARKDVYKRQAGDPGAHRYACKADYPYRPGI